MRDSLCTALQTKILWINWSLNAIDTIETWVSGNLTALTERSQPAIRWTHGRGGESCVWRVFPWRTLISTVTSVPSPCQRCPGNTRGAPVHSSSRADRPHLRLVSLPALKQRAHGDKARSLSMRQKPNSLSFSRSRQQCVTDQHHHEHRTDSPAPGYDREYCHKPARHHHPRP